MFLPWDRANGFGSFPLEVWVLDEGWLILSAAAGQARLAGALVTHVDGTPVSTINARVRPLLSLDSEYGATGLLPYYVTIPEVLRGLALTRSARTADFTIRFPDGSNETVALQRQERSAASSRELISLRDGLPLWLLHRDARYWSTYLPGDRLTYAQLNSSDIGRGSPDDQFLIFTDSLVEGMARDRSERLVLDLRWNSGGRPDVAYHLLRAILRAPGINRPGHLFVIVGRYTFSAASTFAVELDRLTDAIFVGEPTGRAVNAYGELRRFRLPRSGLEIRYSAGKIQAADWWDTRPALFPELKAELSAADYRAGRDPALEAIRRYQPRRPVSDTLLVLAARRDAGRVLATYDDLRRQRYNEFDFSWLELDRLADSLIAEHRGPEAIMVLRRNVDLFPYLGTAHFNLAEAYRQAGNRDSALAEYRQAFLWDKRLGTARDRYLELSGGSDAPQ